MTCSDEFTLALVGWREARGGGIPGMQSVMNVIINRAKMSGKTPYEEATRKWQFSSVTAPGDAELTLYPSVADPQWGMALSLAGQAYALEDITGGALFYYADSMKTPPAWAATMNHTVTIAHQLFFKPK